jgi:hypothetical protein
VRKKESQTKTIASRRAEEEKATVSKWACTGDGPASYSLPVPAPRPNLSPARSVSPSSCTDALPTLCDLRLLAMRRCSSTRLMRIVPCAWCRRRQARHVDGAWCLRRAAWKSRLDGASCSFHPLAPLDEATKRAMAERGEERRRRTYEVTSGTRGMARDAMIDGREGEASGAWSRLRLRRSKPKASQI